MSRKMRRQGYQMGIFLWKRSDEIRDAIYYGPFAHWAKQLMGSHEVRFFYDQMFIKEAGADVATPWHHDLTFWPIRGDAAPSATRRVPVVDLRANLSRNRSPP